MQLYLVQVLGEPAKDHPAFWAAGETGLTLMLWVPTKEQAEQRARAFAAMMHLESLHDLQLALLPTPLDRNALPDWAKSVEQAGFAFCVRHLATGAE